MKYKVKTYFGDALMQGKLLIRAVRVIFKQLLGLLSPLNSIYASASVSQRLLGRPGSSHHRLLKQLQRDIIQKAAILGLAMFAMLLFAISLRAGSAASGQALIFSLVLIVSLIYLSGEIWIKVRRAIRCREDHACELATAECLQALEERGVQVFHDVPLNGSKIDHVVVSEEGVFAIETKSWRKSSREGQVSFDGNALKFPTFSTDKPVNQAVFQAHCLDDYLAQTVGEQITVKPVVSLPGWAVLPMPQHPVHQSCSSINPKNFHYLMHEKVLTPLQVEKISLGLTQACNDDGNGFELKHRDPANQRAVARNFNHLLHGWQD